MKFHINFSKIKLTQYLPIVAVLLMLLNLLPVTAQTVPRPGDTFVNGVLTVNTAMVQDWTYRDRLDITEVIISDGITNIPTNAFTGSSNIRRITMTNSVITIGGYAFERLTNLEELILSNHSGSLGNIFGSANAAPNLRMLRILDRPGANTTFPEWTFRNAPLQQLFIGEGVNVISANALLGATGLECLYLPSTLTRIWDNAFANSSSLKTIVAHRPIPAQSYTEISQNSFHTDAFRTATLFVPVGSRAGYMSTAENWHHWHLFRNIVEGEPTVECGTEGGNNGGGDNGGTTPGATHPCDELVGGVLTVRCNPLAFNYMYRNRTDITHVIIAEGVDRIPDNTFRGSSSIVSIVMESNSVTFIGAYAFAQLPNLQELTLSNQAGAIHTNMFGVPTTEPLQNSLKLLRINNRLTGDPIPILASEFRYLSGLEMLIIGEGIYSIDGWAFENSHSLTCVELPRSMRRINNNAFSNSPNLRYIVSRIEIQADNGAQLPNFCDGMGVNPVTSRIWPNSFHEYTLDSATIFVPIGTAANYRLASPDWLYWNLFERIQEGIPLGDCAVGIVMPNMHTVTFERGTGNNRRVLHTITVANGTTLNEADIRAAILANAHTGNMPVPFNARSRAEYRISATNGFFSNSALTGASALTFPITVTESRTIWVRDNIATNATNLSEMIRNAGVYTQANFGTIIVANDNLADNEMTEITVATTAADNALSTAAWVTLPADSVTLHTYNAHGARIQQNGTGRHFNITTAGTYTLVFVDVELHGRNHLATPAVGGGIASSTNNVNLTIRATNSESFIETGHGNIMHNRRFNTAWNTNRGGGIFLGGTGSTLWINGNVVVAYNATTANDANGGGGGIFVNGNLDMDSAIVRNNKTINTATNGAGIRVTNATIRNSTISENQSANQSGGIHATGTAYIYNSIISGNTARTGAAGANLLAASTVDNTSHIINSRFIDNSSETNAGALRITHNLTIMYSEFRDNTAATNGGAITFFNLDPANPAHQRTLSINSGTTFSGNTAGNGARRILEAHRGEFYTTRIELPIDEAIPSETNLEAPWNAYLFNNYDIEYDVSRTILFDGGVCSNLTGFMPGTTAENPNMYVVPSAQSFTIPANEFVCSGHIFTGWTASDGRTGDFADGATITNVTTDFTLTAQWEEIVFNCDGDIQIEIYAATRSVSSTMPDNDCDIVLNKGFQYRRAGTRAWFTIYTPNEFEAILPSLPAGELEVRSFVEFERCGIIRSEIKMK